MSLHEIDSQAPTIEEAIQKGLDNLQVDKDRVDIKILDEGASGLFGLMGSKPAIVRLKLKTTPQNTPVSHGLPNNTSTESVEKKTQKIIDTILSLMNLPDAAAHVALREDAVNVNIQTSESGVLIGKQGSTLQALQLLMSLLVSRGNDMRTNIYVDVNGYRKQCEEKLTLKAHDAAQEVKQKGDIKRLDPMPAMDRRIIHMALKNDTDVMTESEGSGSFRTVLIKPKK
ncbi:MAG: RNA-binding cell elongation regulator Jag/EloR [bacterium]